MIQKKAFVGTGLDLDSEDRFIKGYRYALNCHIGTSDGDNIGAVENVKGNQLLAFPLPPDTNKCIGSYEDRVGNRVIYFVYNSSGNHLILQYLEKENKIVELMRSPLLNFKVDQLITGVALEDNLLYWTDGFNPQRKLNTEKARTDKNLVVHLHYQFDPPPLTDYTLTIRDANGFVLAQHLIYTVPGPNNATVKEITAGITLGINALAQTDFSASNKGVYVELQLNIEGYHEVELVSSNPNFTAMVVYENMYQQPVLTSYFDLLKYPPNFPPLLFKENNPVFKQVNDADQKLFEFRLRYYYDDGERSALGPISKNPSGEFPFNDNKDEFYKVVYFDKRLSDARELCIIKAVELIFRQGNTGVWKTVGRIERSEIVGSSGTFFFLNNQAYSAISTKDGDKPFDALPLLSNGIELMNNYCFLDAKLEGYDAVIPDVLITLKVNREVPFLSTNDRGAFLRRPGFYKWAQIYYDRGNRSATVSTDPSMHLTIPGYSDDLNVISYVEPDAPEVRRGTVEANWKVRHQPPIWATHWGWARTVDSIANGYLVSRVTGSNYLQADKTTATSFGAANARYVELSFGHWVTFNNDNPDADYGWSFVEGDRMRILKSSTNTWHTTISTVDVVEAVSGAVLLVAYEAGDPNIIGGSIVQLYTPGKEVDNELYFETGEFFEIGNPHQANRYHKGQFLDQDPNNLFSSPAVGTFEGADNYRIVSRAWGTIDLIIDSQRADQRYKDRLDSYNIGRPNVYSPNLGQSSRGHTIRNSNKRFVGTNINGYATFDAIDATDLQKNYGDIKHLARIDNILLSLHTREAVSLYIEENIYTDVSGSPTVTVSDKVIGNDRVLRGGFGTDNPESFTLQDSKGYWFCTNKGQYVRYSGDGVTPISDYFMSRFFHTKGLEISQYGGNVYSTYDVFHGKVVVAFSEIKVSEDVVLDAVTVVFDERTNFWTSFFSFHPENMEKINTRLVTFKDGALWVHSANSIHNNFYGVQYTSQILPVFNDAPSATKVFQSISVEATDLWLPIEITTSEGQQSSLIAEDFEHLENIFYAAILCDENTPNIANPITQGDVMRSTVLRVLLENRNTEKSVLYFVNVQGVLSYLSNT